MFVGVVGSGSAPSLSKRPLPPPPDATPNPHRRGHAAARQILEALSTLRDAAVVHCDLKPENILLHPAGSGRLKLIDFGSACFEGRTVYSYIQSR